MPDSWQGDQVDETITILKPINSLRARMEANRIWSAILDDWGAQLDALSEQARRDNQEEEQVR